MHAPVRFFFDYVSPYAYLASTQVREVVRAHGREVEPVPVVFGAMLDATGSLGPAEIPAKRDYLQLDIVRLAKMFGVPIAPPATHPFNPLLALRVTGCVRDHEARWRLIDAFYSAAWRRSLRLDQPEVVTNVATEAGFDGPSLVAEAAAPDAKTRLRDATTEAIAAGAFGVPSMLVDGELFWGVDSLPLLARYLGGERVFDEATLARWRAVSPSVVRASAQRVKEDR